MRELFILIAHLLVTLAKLARPGGLGAVAAESLTVKHQLLIMKRAQRSETDLMGSAGTGSVCAFRVTQTPEQDGCDTEGSHASVLSSRPGEAQVSSAL
jgi:hypothetical protein